MPFLTFGEIKRTCEIGYDGKKNVLYRFPDGNIWTMSGSFRTRITGFKAVLSQGNEKKVLSMLSIYSNNLMLTGHSLGGVLSAYCSVITHLTTYMVNPVPLIGVSTFHNMFGRNDQIMNFVAAGGEFVSSSLGTGPRFRQRQCPYRSFIGKCRPVRVFTRKTISEL